MTMRRAPLLVGLALLPWAGGPRSGLAQSGDGATLSGAAQMGFRTVNVSGRDEKFQEDLNLQSGPRLFHFSLVYTPPRAARGTVDKVEVDAHNLGGDPFEVLRASAKKVGRYRFEYDHRKSSYFYDDIILPSAQANARLSNGGDFHTFDFRRIRDAGLFAIDLTSSAKLTLGFDRFTKVGQRTTTLDAERNEFELQGRIDERMDEYSCAFEYSWRPITIVLEEKVRQYDNALDLFLPGRSQGTDPESSASLDDFFLDQPYNLRSLNHTARILANPNPRLTLRGAATASALTLDLDVSERSQGTDSQGAAFATATRGAGSFDRDLMLFDIDASYLLTDHVVLMGAVRRHSLDQDGDVVVGGGEPAPSSWALDSTGVETGLRLQLSPTLTVSGGARHESRDSTAVRGSAPEDLLDRNTRATGGFVGLGWRPAKSFRLLFDYEDSSFDDPYTLASPTGRRLARLRGQWGRGEGLSASGSLRFARSDNSDSGWRDDHDTVDARVGYRKASLSASVGYSLVRIDRSIDQQVAGIDVLVPVAYDVEATSIEGRLIWSFVARWKIGAHARRYESTGTFRVRRNDLNAWIEALVGKRYVAHLGLRVVDYGEPARGFNDYAATIVESSLGYRW